MVEKNVQQNKEMINYQSNEVFPPQADIKSLLGTDSVDHLPPILTHDPRVYSKELTEEDEAKEEESWSSFESWPSPRTHNIRLLQALSPRDVKVLIQAEEELSQAKVSKYFEITVVKDHLRVAFIPSALIWLIPAVPKNMAHQLDT